VPDAPGPGPWTAGRLIDAAGLKGYRSGGAQVSPMHANYIVNTGKATAADVRRTIGHVQRTVRDRFGVELETEVKVIGPDGRIAPARP
jgi:UDP-N-acetylmuramate dehydrogenase